MILYAMGRPSSNSPPPVTVLMPVYNGARFLDEAIESIRNQTYKSFEFLTIDDGSTDDTPRILARYAESDSRIRIVTQENRGLIATLNRGFQEACSPWIARMDADDIAYPNRLELQMSFLETHPEIGLVGGAIDVIDIYGRVTQTIRLPETPDAIRSHMRELGCALAHPTVVVRREAVLSVGGLRRAYRHAEDYDLWLRLIEKTDFANLREPVLRYRRHDEAVSNKHLIQQLLSSFCARMAAKRRLEGCPDPTADMDLITPEAVRRLGAEEDLFHREMLRGLYEAAEMAITQGRRSAAAEFLLLARPYADAARLRRLAAELNQKAVNIEASPDEEIRHRKLLMEASPDIYRQLFKVAVRAPAPPSAARESPMTSNTLVELIKQNRYNTDKSEEGLRLYGRAFSHLRTRALTLLEIGVNRGGSLYMWRDYFPQASIIGVDLHIPADFVDSTGRCRIAQGDQNNPASIRALVLASAPNGVDIIIDDASHLGAETARTFRALFYDCLAPGGFYAIEDWGTGYWAEWPDGGRPRIFGEPTFPNEGPRFPSHDRGMVGFVKQLIDECALSDIFHPRFGVPRTRKSWVRSMQIIPGLVVIEKARD